MEYAVELMDSGAGEQAVDDQLLLINRQILELNLMAPSLSLHRRKVSRDTIREQAAKWNEGG
ncbi:hypothetical protein N6H14_06600 [Paenibacillus sp. CC-CFT747]|nr:hypothetical protein N6H14_06600 [Paenibacillus sp. CC-CFT747]